MILTLPARLGSGPGLWYPSRVHLRRSKAAQVVIGGLVGVALSAALAGCSAGADMTGSVPHQVRAWAAGSGMASVDASLGSTASAITAAVSSGNLDGLRAACTSLGSQVARADGFLPTPDQQLTNDVSLAYAHFYDAAHGCLNEKHSIASGAYRPFVSDLRLAHQALVKAQARELALVGP